jgi:hypothetical protein
MTCHVARNAKEKHPSTEKSLPKSQGKNYWTASHNSIGNEQKNGPFDVVPATGNRGASPERFHQALSINGGMYIRIFQSGD